MLQLYFILSGGTKKDQTVTPDNVELDEAGVNVTGMGTVKLCYVNYELPFVSYTYSLQILQDRWDGEYLRLRSNG